MKHMIILILFLTCFVFAQEWKKRQIPWEHMDTNRDGKISKAEWKFALPIFEIIDANQDGYLTKEEIQEWKKQREGKPGKDEKRRRFLAKIKQMDINQDGEISKEEWKGKPEMFDKIDKDKNGFLSKAELQKAAAERNPNAKFFQYFLFQMDTNQDGKISKEEWKGFPETFELLDKNKDKFICHEEIAMAYQKAKQKKSHTDKEAKEDDESQEESDDEEETMEYEEEETKFEEMPKKYDFFSRIDKDKDSKISKEEWLWPSAMFDKIDTNRDGFITRAEYDKFDFPQYHKGKGVPSVPRHGPK